ncbi:helix-turn-helix domain-containing protein [Limosilactobacillus fermentum]|nr:helix-turn-helix transcriptional regulator [Limosilactobacillus fermentum]
MLSVASVAKLGKDANVTTDLLMKICTGLDCKLNDICETVPNNEE